MAPAKLSKTACIASRLHRTLAVQAMLIGIIPSMEVDQAAAQGPPPAPELPTLSLPVLAIVKDAQSLHGLKHSDYQRYRQYCSRRLRRIYKSVRFLHGRGRYQKKKIEPEGVKDVRHLHIPLVQAERAWAYAMDLKSQLEQEQVAAKRQHLVRRLSKAASHAAELVALTAARCDARTQLEAEAYSLWMAGSVLLEKETDWEGALARFLKARWEGSQGLLCLSPLQVACEG
ncbi:hypothetical protein ABPG75_012658 [Micractinium tetrahymenae]